MTNYAAWFERLTGLPPHPWQRALGDAETCPDRLLRVPTGFGKTAGAALPWLYHRAERGRADWPTRLVFCLPMRVLVEQTERVMKGWVKKAGLDVPVFVLLGGREEASWVDRLEEPAILVGTQDMLLSRALNRGYGVSRGAFPMEFGMLHRDALWVLDEVQLMDVGLATTAQLRAFRDLDREAQRPELRPSAMWWMSATLQPSWLETVDHAPRLEREPLPTTRIDSSLRQGGLWDVKKQLERRADVATPEELALLTLERHEPGALSLVIVNTVDRAAKTFDALTKLTQKKGAKTAELRLVHSRFRGAERRGWDFLSRKACTKEALPVEGRIVVSTQIVEAGVDLSARLLVTELAPWSSLVQRFGRCARYQGETGAVIVCGAATDDMKKSLPYAPFELVQADKALGRLIEDAPDVSPKTLEAAEEHWAAVEPDFVAKLYPYEPVFVLRRPDLDDLFDTSPDLSGADLDVSRYIRSGDERDVSVFWRELEATSKELRDVVPPSRDELCPVPIGELGKFKEKLEKPSAYVLDYLDGSWRRLDKYERVVPGMRILLPRSVGGYDPARGWDGASKAEVSPIEAIEVDPSAFAAAAASADDDTLSEAEQWKSIATHGREAGAMAQDLGRALGLGAVLTHVLGLAGRWHDAGKAHEAFRDAIRADARAEAGPIGARVDLAKAPKRAWRRPDPYPNRPGFRHELASTLLLFEVLRRAAPDHPALVGPYRPIFEAMGEPLDPLADDERIVDHPLANEVAQLSADDFDLLAWLVCTHHGKVRCTWTSTPRDQEAGLDAIHGVRAGDALPSFALVDAQGARHELPETRLSLAAASLGLSPRYGRSWQERVSGLLHRHGPFSLAYLEAVLRIADWRASRLTTGEDQ